MQLTLTDIGKKFNRQWVFKGINLTIHPNQSIALVGNNGSGKSTLLQIIFNYQTYSKGEIVYSLNQSILTENELVGKIAIAAPYIDLLEDFTLLEMLHFHFSLIPKKNDISIQEMIIDSGLSLQEHKAIKFFSSGMKQRLKLVLAIYADTPLLLLDEPCSNLDNQGIDWYRKLIQSQLTHRTIIIASNQLLEYDFCDRTVSILDFK